MPRIRIEKPEIKGDREDKSRRRKVEVLELSTKYLYRRAFSESSLLDVLPLPLKKNSSYHCISGGDVDSLSYLKIILRNTPLDHLLISTWCMAAEDVKQLQEWVEEGQIKKLDIYVGEIYPSSYKVEWAMLNSFFKKTKCGRVAVFRNHSKIICGVGKGQGYVAESSANVNTNPRTEQTVLTVSTELYNFYKEYFDNIKSII